MGSVCSCGLFSPSGEGTNLKKRFPQRFVFHLLSLSAKLLVALTCLVTYILHYYELPIHANNHYMHLVMY